MECSKSDIACRNACAKHDDITKSVKAEVDNTFGEPDTSDLKRSFRWALSSSTPPLALYRNYPPVGNSNSNLIFGVPLVDHCVNEDEVPKVMDICIKRGREEGSEYRQYLFGKPTIACFRKIHADCPSRVLYMTQKYGRLVECMVLANLLADRILFSCFEGLKAKNRSCSPLQTTYILLQRSSRSAMQPL